ncbi:hypothetical protein THAOC_02606, partial [Thalassiosira oceanica]
SLPHCTVHIPDRPARPWINGEDLDGGLAMRKRTERGQMKVEADGVEGE